MKTAPESPAARFEIEGRARSAVFWLSLSLLAAVPLAFSPAVHRMFSLPKFAILIIGSSVLTALIVLIASNTERSEGLRALKSKHVSLVCLQFVVIAVSTVFGVSPMASLFGSFENQMGLITRLCFLICFLSLITGIGDSQTRLRQTAWAISLTGLVVATYAFIQFFGRDPFLSPALYTFNSVAGPVVRVIGTLGHADYLGNFLLYTTPLNMAVALFARGRARLLALIATALSISAIVFSGTRGAALGLVAGAIVFSALEFRPARMSLNRRTVLRAAVAAAIVFVSILMISLNPASRSIAARAISSIKEGASGSGRTLLWRDSAKMIPVFAITGCGPEGFRKAFLAYKSKEIAQLAPRINDESAHNSYLDAAISYGLPGAILYVAIIQSSLCLFMRARRRAVDRRTKFIIAGLLSSLAAVAAHNFFIFDQIPTGLSFFAFAALAQAALSVATAEERNVIAPVRARSGSEAKAKKRIVARPVLSLNWRTRAAIIFGLTLAGAAVWYALGLVKADVEINKSFASASAGDYEGAVGHGERATNSPEMTAAYNFQYARALALYADRIGAALNSASYSDAEAGKLTAARMSAIKLATTQAGKSLAHTLTPDSSYLLLAYLALISGNAHDLRAHATEAVKWDPYYPGAHWLMAEAYLAEGDVEQAQREASFALEINPHSQEARSALARARGDEDPSKQTVDELLARGRERADQGRTKKARKKLLRAIRKARGQCPDCHRALASVYEAEGLYEKAIAEWQVFIEQAPGRAASEDALSRIESLKQKAAARH